MAAPIPVVATVSPEGKIEISVPELAPGQRVRVSIQPEEATPAEEQHVLDIVESLPGHRLFKTTEEVDAYIREERDAWDRYPYPPAGFAYVDAYAFVYTVERVAPSRALLNPFWRDMRASGASV